MIVTCNLYFPAEDQIANKLIETHTRTCITISTEISSTSTAPISWKPDAYWKLVAHVSNCTYQHAAFDFLKMPTLRRFAPLVALSMLTVTALSTPWPGKARLIDHR